MTIFAFWEVLQRIDQVRGIVLRADYETGDFKLRKLTRHALQLLDEVANEITRVEIRRVYEPWELRDLEALVQRLRECGGRATKFVRCGDSHALLDRYCRGLDELQSELQRVWPRPDPPPEVPVAKFKPIHHVTFSRS